MSTWIKLLPLELDSIKAADYIEPEWEMESKDRVVGEMSQTARQLFTLSRMLEREADQLTVAHKYCASKSMKSELEGKIDQYKAKSQLLKGAVWISLKDEHKLWGENVGIRAGFKVVTFEDANSSDNPWGRLFGF
jgi:hypothetical protein